MVKLQIKTLNQKSLVVDIEESRTVYDLKKELSLYPDVGVRPELQKLIYAGKILSNEDKLSAYNIDVKKFLVVMILKQPLIEEPPLTPTSTSTSTAEPAAAAAVAEPTISPIVSAVEASAKAAPTTQTTSGVEEFKTPPTPQLSSATATTSKESIVENIVSMGYPEDQVRRALAASFNNPERAIEYLIEGIPTSPSTPEGGDYTDTDADLTMSPFELFRSDPLFQNLRRAIQQHPDLINDAIKRVGEANPALLSLINENQHEFLSMLLEATDDEDDGDDDEDEDDVCS